LAALKENLDAKKAESAKTEALIAQLEKRFQNATRLVSALGDEGVRWAQSLEDGKQQKKFVLGDCLISAAYLVYIGPFTSQYRVDLLQTWLQHCKELDIIISPTYKLEGILSTPLQIQDWQIQGLPSDPLSVVNAVLVTRTRRWPLLIDPQGQANRWIRAKEKENKIRVMRPNEANFVRTLSNCIRVGQPVLLEDVGESLDPQLSPLLLQQTVKVGGRTIIRLGSQDVDYNPGFSLYITTKLANPHYLPDVSIKVTIINFTVTSQGLEDQLLAEVVRHEKAELEEAKDNLVRNMAADAKLLIDTEAKILALLKGNTIHEILDDLAVIDTLEQAKNTSSEIVNRVKEAEVTEQQLGSARNEYRAMAVRGSVLYFTIVDLAVLDPMYQYSLQYFITIFKLSLVQTPEYENLEERLNALIATLTELIYSNICRGLFEAHRLLFSFLIAAQISRKRGEISSKEWDILLRNPLHSLPAPLAIGSAGYVARANALPPTFTVVTGDISRIDNVPFFSKDRNERVFPFEGLIEPKCWAELSALDERWDDTFGGICTAITKTPESIEAWRSFFNKNTPTADKFPEDKYEQTLTSFQRLLFIRVVSPKSLTKCMMEYVKDSIGETFILSPPLDLGKAHGDSSKSIPIIFVLSTGADPTQLLVRFAQSKGYQDKLNILSLGQGQGPVAVRMLEKGTVEGNWVFLQNCHLAASWMPELERICLSYLVPETAPKNPNFRLWLSAMPTAAFPIAVLQNGIKLTNEPPKGVRSNILRSLRIIPPDLYENACPRCPFVWKRILFGLSFFHSLVQERRKYGALGWNIVYEFNDSDFEVSYNHLKMYLNEESEREAAKIGEGYVFSSETIPWKALKYLTGVVNYGGRVTDSWDKRTLSAVLSRFYVEEIAERKPFRLGPSVKFGAADEDKPAEEDKPADESKEEVAGESEVGAGAGAGAGAGEGAGAGAGTGEGEGDGKEEISGGNGDGEEEKVEIVDEDKELNVIYEEDKRNPYVLRHLKKHADAINFADSFPSTEEPEVFGMHENAELALQLNEAQRMIQSITLMQPKRSSGGSKKKKAKESEKTEEEKDENDKVKDKEKEKEKEKEKGKGKEKKKQESEEKTEEEVPEEEKEQGPDEEVMNVVRDILSKLPPQFERSEAKEGVLPPLLSKATMKTSDSEEGKEDKEEEKTSPSSLSVVLSQEIARFNNLLNTIKSSLSELEKAIGGLVVMSQTIEDIYNSILLEKVPQQWADAAYPSLKPLGSWVLDLVERLKFFRKWLVTGIPNVFWFSGFFFPQGFLTAILQTYSRKYKYAIDTLRFKYEVLSVKKEDIKESAEDGVYVYGLFMEAGRWNTEKNEIDESNAGEMFSTIPGIHFLPQQNYTPPKDLYAAPLYKTAARYGVLSTTGFSLLFIFYLFILIVLFVFI
jgi:hypothetical protein